MNAKESIEVLKKNYPDSSFSMLREAVDQAVIALDLQVPKAINDDGECPVCKTTPESNQQNFCDYCGQKFDHPKKEDPNPEIGVIMVDGKPMGMVVHMSMKGELPDPIEIIKKIQGQNLEMEAPKFDPEGFANFLKGLMKDED
jgi:hypothetical protein